ncbi:MAG: hypothetical protein WDO12_06765 [Pseudomonadota bacterium]
MIDGIRNLDLAQLPPDARPPLQRLLDMIRNEPWVFGIALDAEREFFASEGLQLHELAADRQR